MADEALDITGRKIKVGDWVVYGVYSEGKSLSIGQVSKVIPKLVHPKGPYDYKTRTYGPAPDPYFEFKIQVKATKRYQNWKTKEWLTDTSTKTLDKPERFAIIDTPKGVGPEERGLVVD